MSALSSFKRLAGQLMLGPRGELGFITEAHTFQLDNELTRAFATYTVQYIKDYNANPDDHLYRVGLIYQSTQEHPWGKETLRLTDDVVRMIYPVSGVKLNELTSFQKKKRENSIHYGAELLLSYTLKDTPGVPIFIPVLYDRDTTLFQYDTMTSATVMLSEPPDLPVIEVLNLVGPASGARRNLDAFVVLKEKLERNLIRKDARQPVEMKIMESGHASPTVTLPPGASPAPMQDAVQTAARPAATFTGATVALEGSAINTDPNSRQWYNPALHDVTCDKLSRYLSMPQLHADVEQIRQFARFRDLTMSQQKELAAVCPLYHAPSNAQLLGQGTSDQWNLYLLQGQLELIAADGERKVIVGGTDNARNAIAALKPRKFSVNSITPARFLWIHENIIAEIQQRQPGLNEVV